MKFLILSACVCMAVAAPQRFGQPLKKAAVVAAIPFVAAAQVTAQASSRTISSSGTEYDAPILRSESDVRADGFNYNVETGNGIAAEATGSLKQVGDGEALVIRGGYRYTAPDGSPVVFSYIADENGYQPQSDLLPVAPPVPEAIQRSLEYIASRPAYTEAKRN